MLKSTLRKKPYLQLWLYVGTHCVAKLFSLLLDKLSIVIYIILKNTFTLPYIYQQFKEDYILLHLKNSTRLQQY